MKIQTQDCANHYSHHAPICDHLIKKHTYTDYMLGFFLFHLSGQSSRRLSSRSRDRSMSLRSLRNLSRRLLSNSSSLSPIGQHTYALFGLLGRTSFCWTVTEKCEEKNIPALYLSVSRLLPGSWRMFHSCTISLRILLLPFMQYSHSFVFK